MNLEQALEMAMKQAQGADVSLHRGESLPVSFENDRLRAIKTSQSTSISLRVIVEGKLGSSSTTDPDDMQGLVRRALEAAQFGRAVGFRFPASQKAPQVKTYDEAVTATTQADMIAVGEEMIAVLKEYGPDIVTDAGVSKSVGTVQFANSSGLSFEARGTSFSAYVHGTRIRGTDILMAGEGYGWRRRELDHRKIAEKAVEQFRLAERTAQVGSKNMPVLFTPAGMSVLLMGLSEGLSGKNVLLGSSPLKGKVGERLFDSRFGVTDDATVDFYPASGQYDGDGVPHRRLPLVEAGVVKGFYYDLDTAARAGTQSTGHGVGCGPTNWIVAPGEVSYEEMVQGVREGLMVDSVMGLGQGNVISGEFSVNISLGYKIEHGEIVGRVKDTMLTGNCYEALKRIEAIGDTPDWGQASVWTPPVLVGSLSVVA